MRYYTEDFGLLKRLSRLLDQELKIEDAGLGAIVINIDAVGKRDRRPRMPIEYLARKAVISASSDVVAKGARPLFYAAYVSHEKEIERLAEAVKENIAALGGKLISGDVDDEGLRIAITAIGFTHRYVSRYGAKRGEKLYLLGPLGHGGALMYALTHSVEPPKKAIELMNYDYFDVRRHEIIADHASAAIDISDGLSISVRYLEELSGVKIKLYREKLLEAIDEEIIERSKEQGVDAIELALYGGDEYSILFTSSEDVDALLIGEVAREENNVIIHI